MRVNVYLEELTSEVVIVSKIASGTGNEFHGARVYLESPDALRYSGGLDDDRPAITFWTKDANSAQDLAMRLEVGLELAKHVGADST